MFNESFATHVGDFVLLNVGIFGQLGINATVGFIYIHTYMLWLQDTFGKSKCAPVGIASHFSLNYVSDDDG